jgi:putative transposase
MPGFTRWGKAFGVPTRLRPDHGGPFATTTLGRLSQLSAWWVRLGLLPEGIAPDTPHSTAALHACIAPGRRTPPARPRRAQQLKLACFREAFTCQRPHEALDRRTPAAGSAPASRKRPHKRPPLEYPDRFEGRRVSATGGMGSGLATADPSNAGGSSPVRCASKRPMVD